MTPRSDKPQRTLKTQRAQRAQRLPFSSNRPSVRVPIDSGRGLRARRQITDEDKSLRSLRSLRLNTQSG
jgi:hypothetical protein